MKFLQRLLPVSKKGIRSLEYGIAAAVLKNLCDAIPFVFIYLLIDHILRPVLHQALPDTNWLVMCTLCGTAGFCVVLLTVRLRDRVNNIPTYHEMDDLRRKAIGHLCKAPMHFLNSVSAGDIIGNLMNDCAICESAMAETVPYFFAGVISTMIILIGLAFINRQLALCTFCVIPVALIMQISSLKLQARLTKVQISAKQRAGNTTLEYIEGMPVIKAFGLTGEKFEHLAKDLNDFRNASAKLELTAGIFVSGAEVVLQLGIGIVFLAASMLFGNGKIDVVTMLIFFAVILRIYDPIANTIGNLSNLVYMRESLERLRRYFDIPEESGKESDFDSFGIEFRDVEFAYRNDTEKILRRMDFTIEQGKTTAIVGGSGEGKSTILRLIMHLWEPDNGTVLIGGKDISGISTECVNRYISIVDQDIVLFHDTILNNILVGRPNASREEALAAAHATHCDSFVLPLDKGYDTMLVENGRSLSGGERQRLSIARAILKNAPILLLDEPTAYLDAENEKLVREALNELSGQGRTIVIVAHRLTSIETADMILVVENGKICENGSHAQLMECNGRYKELHDLQLADKNLKHEPKEQNV